jgi:hypothetical protein
VADQVQAVFYTHGDEQAMQNLKERLDRPDKTYPVLGRAGEVVQRILYTRQFEEQVDRAEQELVLHRLAMSLLLFVNQSDLSGHALLEEVAVKFMEHGLFRSVVWADVNRQAGYAESWYVRTNAHFNRDGRLSEIPHSLSPQSSISYIVGKRESLAENNPDNLAATAVQSGQLVAFQGYFVPENSDFALPLKTSASETVAIFITGQNTILWAWTNQIIEALKPVWDALGVRIGESLPQ